MLTYAKLFRIGNFPARESLLTCAMSLAQQSVKDADAFLKTIRLNSHHYLDMITKSTIQIWLLPIKLSRTIPFLHCLPFEVAGFGLRRSSRNSIAIKKSRLFKLYVAHTLCQMVTKLLSFVYIVYALQALSRSDPAQFRRELLPLGHVAFVLTISTFLQLYMLLNYKDLLRQAMYCLQICLELRKYNLRNTRSQIG